MTFNISYSGATTITTTAPYLNTTSPLLTITSTAISYADTATTYTTRWEHAGTVITCALPDPSKATYPYAWMTATGTALQEELTAFEATYTTPVSTAAFTGCPLGIEVNSTVLSTPFINSSLPVTEGVERESMTSLHDLQPGPGPAVTSEPMIYVTKNLHVYMTDGSAGSKSTETVDTGTSFLLSLVIANNTSSDDNEARSLVSSHSVTPSSKAWETSPRHSSVFTPTETPGPSPTLTLPHIHWTPRTRTLTSISISLLPSNQPTQPTHLETTPQPPSFIPALTPWLLATFLLTSTALLALWKILSRRRTHSRTACEYTTKPPRPELRKRLSLVGGRRSPSPVAVTRVSEWARRKPDE